MFTINIYLRFALMAIGIVGGIALSAAYGFWYGFPFILVGIFLTIGYFLIGTIASTNTLLSQMRLDEAEQRLKLTFFPKMLLVGYKGMYYMTHGAIAMQRKDWANSEKWVKMALDAGLPTDNEKAGAMLQLLMINAQRGQRNNLTNQLAEIKKLNITDPTLKSEIKNLEQQLKMAQANPMNPATLAMMGGRNGFRPGSKRPRPKVR
jgi:hypothetical protein